MNASALLKSISNKTEPNEILSKLRDVREKISELSNREIKVLNQEKDSQDSDDVDSSDERVIMLQNDLEKLNALVNLYQTQADRNIPNFKMLTDISITDYKSAYDATLHYSKEWFANCLFSDEGKVDVAYHLLTVISKYCKDNLETLQMVVNRDKDMVDYIAFPKSEDE